MTQPTSDQILAVEFTPHDNTVTVRQYLIDLLATLWSEGSDFSAKRPFGNSDWQWDVYAALVRAGYVVGDFDDDGYLDGVNTVVADALVCKAIESLGGVR